MLLGTVQRLTETLRGFVMNEYVEFFEKKWHEAPTPQNLWAVTHKKLRKSPDSNSRGHKMLQVPSDTTDI